MKKLLLATAVVATVLASPVSARAEVFYLEDVTTEFGGTLTGSFDCTLCNGTDFSAISITDSLDGAVLTTFLGGSTTYLEVGSANPSFSGDYVDLDVSGAPSGSFQAVPPIYLNTDDVSKVVYTTAGGGTPLQYIDAGYLTTTPPSGTPLPAALPLFATGLGALGLFGWRTKRKNTAAIAAV